MSLLSSIQGRIYTPGTDTLKQWQERIFTFVLLSISIAALPPLLISVPQAIKDGMWGNLASYVLGYLLCLSLIFAKKIPFRVRAWTGVLVFFGIGSLAIMTLGPVGSGRIWLFTTSLFATLTLGIRAGMIVLVAQLGILTGFGYLLTSVPDKWTSNVDFTLSIWVITSVTFTFLSVVSILAVGGLIKGLSLALERSRKSRKELLKTTKELNEKIEAHRQSEMSRRESEERWHFALEGAGDGVWDWDLQSKKVFFSARWKKMLGFDSHEIGTDIDEWLGRIHPEDRETVHKEINNILYEQAEHFQNRYRIRCKNQSFLWVLDRGKVMIRNREGKPLRIIGTHSDLTFIKELEDQKIAYEMRLQQSQKMEAIGTLAGGIAHDFNNILGIIQGNAELLEEKLSQHEKEHVEFKNIFRGLDRATNITSKLLTFSRKQTHKSAILNINTTITDLQTLVAKSLTAAITVETNLSEDLWLVNVDQGDFEDAILNLAINARDAMSAGGHLIIETQNKIIDTAFKKKNIHAQPGEYVMISISDTGEGMAEDIKQKIFEPFFTTKDQGKGTGLGLSMVYGFITRTGGFIDIYSVPGKGTTFRLFLPRSQALATDQPKEIEDNEALPVGNETILIVDDEIMLSEIAQSILRKLGYKTLISSNGEAALQVLEQNHASIDLLFSDIVMPGKVDGFTLADTVSRNWPGVKVLLTSGFAKSAEQKQDMNNMQITNMKKNLLDKPYNKIELAKAIRSTLDAG